MKKKIGRKRLNPDAGGVILSLSVDPTTKAEFLRQAAKANRKPGEYLGDLLCLLLTPPLFID